MCESWLRYFHFLGHIVSRARIMVDLIKIEAVMKWEPLKNPTEVHSFLGLAGYLSSFYRIFFSDR